MWGRKSREILRKDKWKVLTEPEQICYSHTGWETRWLRAIEKNLDIIAGHGIAMNLCPALLKKGKHYFDMHETENRLQDVK